MSVNGKPELYVFNAFFMTMRSKYVGKDKEIRCYEVEWDPTKLSWSSFRNDILGPTDPNEAPPNSIRKTILDQYKKLGLSSIPDRSDNGVHASVSNCLIGRTDHIFFGLVQSHLLLWLYLFSLFYLFISHFFLSKGLSFRSTSRKDELVKNGFRIRWIWKSTCRRWDK